MHGLMFVARTELYNEASITSTRQFICYISYQVHTENLRDLRYCKLKVICSIGMSLNYT